MSRYWAWLVVPALALIAGMHLMSLLVDTTPGRKKEAATALLVIVLAVVLVPQVWVGVRDAFKSEPGPANCPPFSSSKVGRCILTETPIILTTFEQVTAGQYEFCVVHDEERKVGSERVGTNTYRLWSVQGVLPIEYKLVKAPCPKKF